MKLFAVIYIKGHLATAMFLWNGAAVSDCQKINSDYSSYLDRRWVTHHLDRNPAMVDPYNKALHLKRGDVRLACEWHDRNPVNNKS